MFQTPPSMKPAQNELRLMMGGDMADTFPALLELTTTCTDLLAHLPPSLSHPCPLQCMDIHDWSYVFKPAPVAAYLHKSLYSPIELPSNKVPLLKKDGVYKLSWPYG